MFARAAVGTHRESAADDLAERREVGLDAGEIGGAASRDAKAGDHLVEYEERTVLARDVAQQLKERLPLQQEAVVRRNGLDDHGGNARALALEERRDGRVVVERQHARQPREVAAARPADDGLPNVTAPEPAATSRWSACP